MNDLNFGIRIGAKDDTQGVLRGAMSGFRRFASVVSKPITIPLQVGRAGLGLLRDINLGLRPIVAGLDKLIERGAGLEVVRKSFESLTGASGKAAEKLARRLVDASSGTLRLSQAMQIANRAMASGMNLDSIGTSIAFISRKAITTGKDAGAAIDTVITGLSRGSTLFLDDFGILVDGLEGVKRTYDAINGSGAWDALGPAAQKAETVRQAIAEMKTQTDKLGISGKESIFVWQSIKNAIGDASDKLFGTIGRSESLRNVLTGVRDVMGGIAEHFDKGGGIADLLFGKKGGESGGLWGFLEAGLLDAGEALGRGILGGILLGLSKLPNLFGWIWEKLKAFVAWLGDQVKSWFKYLKEAIVDGFRLGVDFIKDALRDAWQAILSHPLVVKGMDFFGIPHSTGAPTGQPASAPTTQPATTQPATTQPATTQPATTQPATTQPATYNPPFDATPIDPTGGHPNDPLYDQQRHTNARFAPMPFLHPKLPWDLNSTPLPNMVAPPFEGLPIPTTPDGRPMASAASPHMPGLPAVMGGVVAAALALSTKPVTVKFSPEAEVTLFTMMEKAGRSLLTHGTLGGKSRIRDWFGKFQRDFPTPEPVNLVQVKEDLPTGGLGLSPRGRTQRRNQINLIDREIRKEEARARREARLISAQKAREMREDGYVVTPADRKRWEEEAYKKIVEARTQRLREERDRLQGELAPDEEARQRRRERAKERNVSRHGGSTMLTQNLIVAAIKAALNPGDTKDAVAKIEKQLTDLTAALAGFARNAGLADTKLSSA